MSWCVVNKRLWKEHGRNTIWWAKWQCDRCAECFHTEQRRPYLMFTRPDWVGPAWQINETIAGMAPGSTRHHHRVVQFCSADCAQPFEDVLADREAAQVAAALVDKAVDFFTGAIDEELEVRFVSHFDARRRDPKPFHMWRFGGGETSA